jgi:hypothetical protein
MEPSHLEAYPLARPCCQESKEALTAPTQWRHTSIKGDLGDRVENTKKSSVSSFPKKNQLWVTCLSLLSCLIVVYTSAFVVIDAVMNSRDPNWRTYTSVPGGEEEENSPYGYVFAGTSPVSRMDNREFTVYLAIVLAVTINLTGLGLELLVWVSFLQNGWSAEFEHLWKFGQFSFPLLVTASVGMSFQQDYMAMILFVPGVWKFGCPETLMYMHSALYNNKHSFRTERVVNFLNGCGTAVHHSGSALFISVFLAGVRKPSPAEIGPVLIAVMQHWFVLLRYVNKKLYMAIELVLEVWFEWSIFSNFHENATNHWLFALGSSVLIAAHWMYLLAAFLELIRGGTVEDETSENPITSNDEDCGDSLSLPVGGSQS